MNEQKKQLISDFLIEATEEIANISKQIKELEHQSDIIVIINQIYRSVHTIKGAASFLQFTYTENLCHQLESALDLTAKDAGIIDALYVEVLLNSVDCLSNCLEKIEKENSDDVDCIEQVLSDLKGVINDSQQGEGKKIQEPVSQLDNEIALENKAQQMMQESQIIGKKVLMSQDKSGSFEDKESELSKEVNFNDKEKQNYKEEPHLELVEQEVIQRSNIQAEEPVSQKTKKPEEETVHKAKEKISEQHIKNEKSISDSVVRVKVELLNKIMNTVGELVLNRNKVLRFSDQVAQPEYHRIANELNSITTELQTDIMSTRMQPVSSVLDKFDRVVRDLSRQMNKKIKLELEGRQVELDRTIIDAIKDPLTHLVRNSADHGIESPKERVEKGKPEQGTLKIRAYHESGKVIIELSDDGKGLNTEKLYKKALEKEIIKESETLEDEQIHKLIFHPGFSTADNVTNVSGRGVGMDVVKTNIESMGGQIELKSKENQGTVFRLHLPLTLAIIPALIVEGSHQPFAIPQNNIMELVNLRSGTDARIESVGGAKLLRLRGDLIPLIELDDILKEKEKAEDIDVNIAIINADGVIYGIILHAVRETQEIVVKPLTNSISDIFSYAGATILGGGSVALILDAVGIARNYNLDSTNSKKEDAVESKEKMVWEEDYLLFHLHEEGRFGMPLALIHRVEEVEKVKINRVGDNFFIKYREDAMPLISLDHEIFKKDFLYGYEDSAVLNVVVLSFNGKNYGVLIKEIKDICRVSDSIKEPFNNIKGVQGTVFLDNYSATIIDVYEVLNPYLCNKEEKTSAEVKSRVYEGKTALLVEDSPFFRKVEGDFLKQKGFRVIMANNGSDALEQIRKYDIDIIISDIEMPEMNGLELVRSLREIEEYKIKPIIAMSTKADEADRADGLNAGFTKYLEKFNPQQLEEVIFELVG